MREIGDYRTLTAIVLDKVREMILSLELRPGQRISQEDLSDRLGVSRMPVREAFRVLESEGLVESIPHRGVLVTSISVGDVRELGTIRCALEGTATSLAATRMKDHEVAELRELLVEMDGLGIPPADEKAFLVAHKEFHMRLYASAGLPRLTKIVTCLWEASERYRRACATISDRQREAAQEHHLILDACRKKDGTEAGQLLESHLNKTTEMTIKFLSREI